MSLRDRFDRFRLRTSLTILVPTICVSGLLLAVGVVAAWQLDRIQASATRTVAINVSSMRASEELEIALREVRSRLNYYLLTKDRSHLRDLGQQRQQVDKWLEEARRLATTTFEQNQIQRIEQGYQRLSKDFDRLSQLANESGSEAELEQLGRTLALGEMQGMLDAAHEYLDFNENAITQSSERNQTLTSRLVPTLSLLGICGAVAGVLMGFVISRGVRRRLVECNVPIRDAAGKLNEVLGTLTVTGALDLDDLEPALRQIADRVVHVVGRLQDSERETLRSEQLAAVGQLAAGMAHELRNPLTSMKALVQSSLLGDEPLLDARDLEILEQEIDRMAQLIEAFLEYARPPRLEKRMLDLVETCQRTVNLILPRATQKGLRFVLHLPQSPLHLEGDARQLRQVLLNLFENSLDATPEGGQVWVELQRLNAPPPPITTAPWSTDAWTSTADTAEFPVNVPARKAPGRRQLDSSSHSVNVAAGVDTSRGQQLDLPAAGHLEDGLTTGFHLLIADSGCGIPPELGERIFQPFVSTKETGMGLGLSICRRIVQSHGGHIEGNNLVSGGTAFAIWLPLSENASVSAYPDSKNQSVGHSSDLIPSQSLAVR